MSDEHPRHSYRGVPPRASVTTMNSPPFPVARDYFLRVGEKRWERGSFELIIVIDSPRSHLALLACLQASALSLRASRLFRARY